MNDITRNAYDRNARDFSYTILVDDYYLRMKYVAETKTIDIHVYDPIYNYVLYANLKDSTRDYLDEIYKKYIAEKKYKVDIFADDGYGWLILGEKNLEYKSIYLNVHHDMLKIVHNDIYHLVSMRLSQWMYVDEIPAWAKCICKMDN